jgi:hypothetical protein
MGTQKDDNSTYVSTNEEDISNENIKFIDDKIMLQCTNITRVKKFISPEVICSKILESLKISAELYLKRRPILDADMGGVYVYIVCMCIVCMCVYIYIYIYIYIFILYEYI